MTNTNIILEVKINKKDNSNLNEQLPELKSLNSLHFQFTEEFENNQTKQDGIRQLITTYGTKTEENKKIWVINKKITIKAQGISLDTWNNNDNTINYILRKTSNIEIENQ